MTASHGQVLPLAAAAQMTRRAEKVSEKLLRSSLSPDRSPEEPIDMPETRHYRPAPQGQAAPMRHEFGDKLFR
jgi:hypothetical protein